MKEYMLIFRNEHTEGMEQPSSEQMIEVMAHWKNWIVGLSAQGNYGGTNRLLHEGVTLKPGNVPTDGPYIEGKEMIGGYVIIKAASFKDAVELAKACPNLAYGGNVEVRSVMAIDADVNSATFLEPVGMTY